MNQFCAEPAIVRNGDKFFKKKIKSQAYKNLKISARI